MYYLYYNMTVSHMSHSELYNAALQMFCGVCRSILETQQPIISFENNYF